MRINIYAEELTDRVEIVEKPVADAGTTFYAVRLYLGFPFIHREGDDDSSAITFWVPWTKKEGHDYRRLSMLLRKMAYDLDMHVSEALRKEKRRDG